MNKTERIFKIEQLIAARKLVSFQTLPRPGGRGPG